MSGATLCAGVNEHAHGENLEDCRSLFFPTNELKRFEFGSFGF